MFKILLPAVCLAMSLLATSCQRPLVIKDDDGPSGKAKWELLEFQSERVIQGLRATPFELYVISENQFSRFNGDHKLIEKRPLDPNFGVIGTPAMSDNTFVRLTTDGQSRQVIEFHLARNPAQSKKVPADSLVNDGNGFIEVEFLARSLGAFSSDGTLFLLPARVFPSRHYAFFLFEVLQNPAHSAFTSVKVVRRIDLNDLGADFANLVSLRFLDGNFYATSRQGAWRISPSGEAQKIFTQWMRDVFSWQGKLYITGLNSFDLHVSDDNCLTWERLNQHSDLKMVETAGDMFFTQEVLGNPYLAVPDDFKFAKKIIYPAGATVNPSVYYGVAFFGGQYFMSIDREVYFTEKVAVE